MNVMTHKSFDLKPASKGETYGLLPKANIISSLPKELQVAQAHAFDIFQEVGVPTPMWERWKYTNLRPYFTKRPEAGKAFPYFTHSNAIVVKLENGILKDKKIDLGGGAFVLNAKYAAEQYPHLLSEVITAFGDYQKKPFVAMNTAAMKDVVLLYVPHAVEIAKPILFVHGADSDTHAKLILHVDEKASCSVIEYYEVKPQIFFNLHQHISLKPQARLKHYRVQTQHTASLHVTSADLYQDQASQYQAFSLNRGSALMRHEVATHLLGGDATCRIHGLYLAEQNQLSDSTIQINHFEPHCFSEQKYKGVVCDEARAVFQGKTYVDKKAQKTDGYQLHHALLLSKRAEVYSKPELEIYADDVKCSHGSATNNLDPDMLFYMRARGISQKDAYALLISAYLTSMLDDCEDTEVAEFTRQIIDRYISEKSWGNDDLV